MSYQNLKDYVRTVLGQNAEEVANRDPQGADNFAQAIQTYQSSKGELTDEDLNYIRSVNEVIWRDLGFIVDHWELQCWDDLEGGVVECYDYFSIGSALRDYNIEIMNGGYWRIIAVDSEGIPEEYTEVISNF